MTDNIKELKSRYAEFIARRDWEQFHTPKNLAEAISIEANELLEIFLWHDNLPPERFDDEPELIEAVEEELADVVIYCLGLAIRLDIDLVAAVDQKLDDNEARFDPDTSAEMTAHLRTWRRDHNDETDPE